MTFFNVWARLKQTTTQDKINSSRHFTSKQPQTKSKYSVLFADGDSLVLSSPLLFEEIEKLDLNALYLIPENLLYDFMKAEINNTNDAQLITYKKTWLNVILVSLAIGIGDFFWMIGSFYFSTHFPEFFALAASVPFVALLQIIIAAIAVATIAVICSGLFNLNDGLTNKLEYFKNHLLLFIKVAAAVIMWTVMYYVAQAIINTLVAADISLTGGATTAIIILATALGTFLGLLLATYAIDACKSFLKTPKGEKVQWEFNHWDNVCLAAAGFAAAAVWTTSFTFLPALFSAVLPVHLGTQAVSIISKVLTAAVAGITSSLFFAFGLAPRKEQSENFELQQNHQLKTFYIYDQTKSNFYQSITKQNLPNKPCTSRSVFHFW